MKKLFDIDLKKQLCKSIIFFYKIIGFKFNLERIGSIKISPIIPKKATQTFLAENQHIVKV